jgi:hypothetical protein
MTARWFRRAAIVGLYGVATALFVMKGVACK